TLLEPFERVARGRWRPRRGLGQGGGAGGLTHSLRQEGAEQTPVDPAAREQHAGPAREALLLAFVVDGGGRGRALRRQGRGPDEAGEIGDDGRAVAREVLEADDADLVSAV